MHQSYLNLRKLLSAQYSNPPRYHEYDQKWVPIDYSNELTLDEELEDYGDTYFEQYILNGPYEMTESIDMNSVDSIDEAIHSLQSVVAILDRLVTG